MKVKNYIVFIVLMLSLLVKAYCEDHFLIAGTYSPAMYVYRFNSDNGNLSRVSTLNLHKSQYLAVSANQKYVYVANEKGEHDGGELTSLSFDKTNGILSIINAVSTGPEPYCFVDTGKDNNWVVTGNYRSGDLTIFRTNPDGSLQPGIQTIDHRKISPKGVVPHVHCTLFSPENKYIIATDLGLDKLFSYPFSKSTTTPLDENKVVVSDTPKGYGPRHLAFHPNGKYLYMIAEKSGHIITYNYNAGNLTQFDDLLSDSTNHNGKGGSADIHITPDGKFLYVTHRTEANDIVGYKITRSGKLIELFHQSTLGVQPRNFVIDSTGSFLLVANVDSGNIIVFRINKKSGFISSTGNIVYVEKPFCLKMIK